MSENNEIKKPLNKNFREPKLRFKSFENQWNKSTFGDVVNLSKKKYNPLKSNESLIDLEMDSVESKTGRLLVKYNSLSFDSIKNSFTENDVLYGKLRPYLRKYYMPKFNGVCSSEFWVLNSTYLVQNFLYYYISSDSFNFETNKTCGTKMPRAEWSQIIKLEFYYPEIDEQRIIGTFLQLFDRKIDILSNKIETLKKYKEGIEKYAYKFVENQGASIKFLDLFDNLIEKNNHNFQQYTIGKNGIKKIDEINYDISNHKVFKKFNVIVGIGIDEIGINKDLEYGSVSPVYDVYNIRNLKYFDSIYVTLKEQLWKKRNFITRKSTRREFEVDKYELKKMILKVVDNKDFTNVYQSITNIKKVIEILKASFNNLKILKTCILRHMFI